MTKYSTKRLLKAQKYDFRVCKIVLLELFWSVFGIYVRLRQPEMPNISVVEQINPRKAKIEFK